MMSQNVLCCATTNDGATVLFGVKFLFQSRADLVKQIGLKAITVAVVILLMGDILLMGGLIGERRDRLSSIAAFVAPSVAYSAPMCRQLDDHRVCILTIKRSAKNYWEYRAAVKIDDQKYPVETYNCRDRTKTLHHGKVMHFVDPDAGTLICNLLYR